MQRFIVRPTRDEYTFGDAIVAGLIGMSQDALLVQALLQGNADGPMVRHGSR